MDELVERRSGLLLNVLAVGAAAGAPVLASQAGREDGTGRNALLAGAALCAALVVLLGLLIQRSDRRRIATAEQVAVDAEAELAKTLNGALAPITSYLGELADTVDMARRATLAGELRQAVAEAATRLTAPQARSAYYAADLEVGVLRRDVYAGRAALPRDEFRAGTPDGDAVLDLVAHGDLVVIDDVAVDPMVTPSAGSGYTSVLGAAVMAGRLRLGLLTVDSPEPGAFTANDVELVRVLANLLGAGLAHAGPAGQPSWA